MLTVPVLRRDDLDDLREQPTDLIKDNDNDPLREVLNGPSQGKLYATLKEHG